MWVYGKKHHDHQNLQHWLENTWNKLRKENASPTSPTSMQKSSNTAQRENVTGINNIYVKHNHNKELKQKTLPTWETPTTHNGHQLSHKTSLASTQSIGQTLEIKRRENSSTCAYAHACMCVHVYVCICVHAIFDGSRVLLIEYSWIGCS